MHTVKDLLIVMVSLFAAGGFVMFVGFCILAHNLDFFDRWKGE